MVSHQDQDQATKSLRRTTSVGCAALPQGQDQIATTTTKTANTEEDDDCIAQPDRLRPMTSVSPRADQTLVSDVTMLNHNASLFQGALYPSNASIPPSVATSRRQQTSSSSSSLLAMPQKERTVSLGCDPAVPVTRVVAPSLELVVDNEKTDDKCKPEPPAYINITIQDLPEANAQNQANSQPDGIPGAHAMSGIGTTYNDSPGNGEAAFTFGAETASPPVCQEGTMPSAAQEGLVQAQPLSDSKEFTEGLEQAEPISAQDLEQQERAMQEQARTKRVLPCWILIATLFLVLVAGVGLTYWGIERRNKSDDTITDTTTHSNSTTTPPIPILIWNSLPNSTKFDIAVNPKSPQAKAYQWMEMDPNLREYSLERQLQRFALGVFYYSTGGNETWQDEGGGNTTILFQLRPPPGQQQQGQGSPMPGQGSPQGNGSNDRPTTTITFTSDQWLSYGTHECNWMCKKPTDFNPCPHDNQTISVIALSLNNMQGTLPKQLALLTALEWLSLRDNHRIGGTIPTQMALLKNLENLNVPGAQLTGSIPTQLALMDKLGRLNLAANSLTGSLPSQLGALTALSQLRVPDNVGITGTEPSQLGNLQQISLGGTSLTGTPLAAEICGIRGLRFDCSNALCGCQVCPCEEFADGLVLENTTIAGNDTATEVGILPPSP